MQKNDKTDCRLNFENFLCEKADEIDNAAYDLVCAIASIIPGCDDSSKPEWNISFIREIVDAAEIILSNHNIRCCDPFFTGDDEIPCYCGAECKTKDCAFKRKSPEDICENTELI